jgi:hypothetical protein
MPWKTGEIIFRFFISEVIEKKERIEIGSVAEAESSPEFHACAFDGGLSLCDLSDWSD